LNKKSNITHRAIAIIATYGPHPQVSLKINKIKPNLHNNLHSKPEHYKSQWK
jgi:hypothetical protein